MKTIGVIGLGYVGLPLAIAFGRLNKVIGFDTNLVRIEELKSGIDRNCEQRWTGFVRQRAGKDN